ncbi:MAG: NAD(P)-dependent oxidoreductase [Pseudomonadota bacterium]
MMKVFVTGAEGFVGKRLVARLQEKGVEVMAVDIVATHSSSTMAIDIRSREIQDSIPDGVDAIIHLAGLTRTADCQNKGYSCFEANVLATLNLIDAAEARKARQFIFASSEWVYGEWKDPGLVKDSSMPIDPSVLAEYAFSKFVTEINLRQKHQHGFCPVTMLRFGIIYGPREKNWSAVESLFNSVRTKDEVLVGSLRTGRCFIHVDDIVTGIIASIGLQGIQVLDIQGPCFVTLGDIIETSKQITGRSPKVVETAVDSFNVRNISNQNALSLIQWWPEYGLEKGLKSLF